MIHNITTVARSRFLDPAITEKVAKNSKFTSKIGGEYFVSTFYCDDFIAEVRAAQGSELDNARIRKAQIQQYFGARACQ